MPAIGTDAQSDCLSTPGVWMIGISAGEPLIMPILPWANCSQSGVRFLVPGFGSVSPAATRPLRNVKAATLGVPLIVHLPWAFW